MSALPLEQAPDFAEPFVAWRVWQLVEEDGELALASVVKRTLWPASEPLVAECLGCRSLLAWIRRRPPHPAPDVGCECGIYGTDLDRAARYLAGELAEARSRVIGRVALWGTVVECEHGFRASCAYPTVLYVAADAARDRGGDLAARLARYSVPVELVSAARRELPRLLETAAR